MVEPTNQPQDTSRDDFVKAHYNFTLKQLGKINKQLNKDKPANKIATKLGLDVKLIQHYIDNPIKVTPEEENKIINEHIK
jgi:hypothetical protein